MKARAFQEERVGLLVDRLVQTIRQERLLPWGDLAVRVEAGPNDRALLDAVRSPPFVQAAVIATPAGRAEHPPSEALVFPMEDLDEIAHHPAVWRLALRYVRTPATHLCTEGELRAAFRHSGLRAAFALAIRTALTEGVLPAGVCAVLRRGHFYLLLQDDLLMPTRDAEGDFAHPMNERSTSERFAEAFERAFHRLDVATGRRNFVKLLALRQALPEFSRDVFDRELNTLRRAGRFSLDASEGTHDRTTPEERDAGLVEAGRRLLYCARR